MKEIVEGKTFHQPLGGFVGVANVGLDTIGCIIRWRWRICTASAGWPGIPS